MSEFATTTQALTAIGTIGLVIVGWMYMQRTKDLAEETKRMADVMLASHQALTDPFGAVRILPQPRQQAGMQRLQIDAEIRVLNLSKSPMKVKAGRGIIRCGTSRKEHQIALDIGNSWLEPSQSQDVKVASIKPVVLMENDWKPGDQVTISGSLDCETRLSTKTLTLVFSETMTTP